MARKNGKDKGVLEWPIGSGKWFVRIYHNAKEQRYPVENKTQGRLLYGKLKAEQREGLYYPEKYKRKSLAFNELAESYKKYADIHHKRKGDDTPRLNRWTEAFKDQDVSTIKLTQVEQILYSMKNEDYAPATIARYLVVLKACFNRAVRDGLLVVNPIQRVKAPKVNNILVRYLTSEQEKTLLEALPERFRAIVLTAINTGMRQGELLRLKWQDIDSNSQTITVWQTKAGESRKVLMNSIVWRVLETQRSKAEDDRVFPHDDRYLRRAFDKAVKDAKLAPFRFHDLRHTFASRLAMNGANDRTLQELLGHKTQRMVLRYAHLSPTHLWHAVEGLTKTNPILERNRIETVNKEESVKEGAT